MPELKYNDDYNRMDCLGMDLNRPVDSVKPGKFPFLKNCRAFQAGRIEPRDGLTLISQVVAGQNSVHSCRRLNDPLNSTFTRVVGAGTHVAIGQNTFTDTDSGYSGNPLALVPLKPTNSPAPFMYIADSSRMRKVNASGGLHTVGFPMPNSAPAVTLSNSPAYKVVDDLQSSSGWSGGGTTTGVSTLSGGSARVNTTLATILYDTGTTGWASCVLTSMTSVGTGARLDFNAGGGGGSNEENAVVQVAFPASTTSNTIASIVYDSGTTGLCSIVFTTPFTIVFCDSLVNDSTQSEYARIIAVATGPDGTNSIRLSTVGTWVAGDTVSLAGCIRVYLTNTHVGGATEPVVDNAVRIQLMTGVGTATKTSLSIDLTQLKSGLTATPSDYMHISMRASDVSQVTELRLQLDVDSTGASQDFAHNYYFKAFRANDITSSITGSTAPLLTTRQNFIITRSIVGEPDATPAEIAAAAPPPAIDPNTGEDIYQYADYTYTNPVTGVTFQQTVTTQYVDQNGNPVNDNSSTQVGSGTSQWAELVFPISELIRIGTDSTRSLANVDALQVWINASGAVNVDVDNWYISGGYGLDNVNATSTPYHYRYRAREKSTNVASMWSPSSRYNVQAHRQAVTVAPSQYAAPSGTSLGTSDFFIDIERFGGQIADWHYIGTIANSATPSYTDILDDTVVGGQPIIGQIDYQPWPIIGPPVNGTTGQVSGTSVKDSGTNFNVSWSPGTRILINNLSYTIRRVISTSLLEILENGGNQTGQTWRIDAPTILAQPLPVLWEWDGVLFACGDTDNPGRLYYSNQDSETTQPVNTLDLTYPSDPLMNGVQYNVRSFIWSAEAFMQLLQTGDPSNPYRHENIPNGKGLFSRWALTRNETPALCYLGKDGIYMTTGGSPISLTDADLYELFPNEGNLGKTVNLIPPPNIVSAQAANLRLEYYDDYLYFDYQDTNGDFSTLLLAFDLGAAVRGEAPGGWFFDLYFQGLSNQGPIMHYGEEGQGIHSILMGGANAKLYQYTGNSDDGTAISMEISTMSRNQGQARILKDFGETMVDCDLGGLSASAQLYFNFDSVVGPTTTLTNSSRGFLLVSPTDLSTQSWYTAYDVALHIIVSVSTSVRPFFYAWEHRWTFEAAPLSDWSWEITQTTFGMVGFKHFGLWKITHVSTVDLNLLITVDGVAQSAIVIPNSGGVYKETIFRVPVMKGKIFKVRLVSSDGSESMGVITPPTTFRLDTRDSYCEIKDWAMDSEYSKLRIFSDFSLIEG